MIYRSLTMWTPAVYATCTLCNILSLTVLAFIWLFFLGHYPVPDYTNTRLQITGRSDVIIPPSLPAFNGSKTGSGGSMEKGSLSVAPLGLVGWLAAVEHKPLYFFIILLILSVAALFFYVRAQVIQIAMCLK